MRGSNVLRLRARRPLGHHYYFSPRRRYNSSTEPISDTEFLEAWTSVASGGVLVPEMGLAVSGGVDSMALATLYARAEKSLSSLPRCHGIIVDHKVRPESSEEAEWVAEQLRSNFGMKSSIIRLQWPKDFDPADTQRFESEARVLRYQALGRACKDRGIQSLLVAHHGDDQAETILMRLVNGRLRSGLQGMRSVTAIPECFGMHGVHHSSGGREVSFNHDLPFPFEGGGIHVLRPLLGFEKKRLIATCETYGTKWAEDKTNSDKTLTTRNAIRHIMRHHKLPKALQASSLISLAQHMQGRIEAHAKAAEQVFEKMPLQLDMQTGTIIVRFPPADTLLNRPIITEADRIEARNTATLLVHRVADIVSPRDHLTIGQFSSAVDKVWPSLASDVKANLKKSDSSFCMYGLWWEAWESPSKFLSDQGLTAFHPHEWQLSRQPPHIDEIRDAVINVPSSLQQPLTESEWHLFDGRWWIKILHPLRKFDIRIRHFTDEDLSQLWKRSDSAKHVRPKWQRSMISDPIARRAFDHTYIRTALSLIKPYSLRRTLPGIFARTESGKEILVGLPTLGCAVHDGVMVPVSWDQGLPWEVRYKKIDWGPKDLTDVVAGGMKESDIMKLMKWMTGTGHRNSRVRVREDSRR